MGRLGANGTKLLHKAPLSGLPDGTFVVLNGEPSPPSKTGSDFCWLKWNGALWRWSHDGYVEEQRSAVLPAQEDQEVFVMTPPSMVAALSIGGFEPGPPHASAHRWCRRAHRIK